MKVPFALTLFFLITAVTVSAGGPQNCLERVWLYQAYLIDQHNPEPARKIGFKCPSWDKKNNACTKNEWVPCRPRQGRPQCDFDDFQVHLGNQSPGMSTEKWAVKRPDGSLDAIKTADNCLWSWRQHNKAPFNFKGFNSIKNGNTDYNNLIYRIGQITNDNHRKPAVRAAAGEQAFRNVDYTLSQITRVRVADHGGYLFEDARKGLASKGITVAKKDLGANPFYREEWVPVPPTKQDDKEWKTVDWERTINDEKLNNPPDTRASVREWLDNHYRGSKASKSAKDHWQVLRSFKTIRDQTNRCRKH